MLLTIAVCGGVAAAAWRVDQPHDVSSFSSSWRRLLGGGVILIAATFTAMTIPWPAVIDLCDNAYWLIVTSIMSA